MAILVKHLPFMQHALGVLLVGVIWGAAGELSAQSTPLGNDFQVNVLTTGAQLAPRAAVDGNGNFVVIWGSNSGTFGRNVFSGGTLGPEFFIDFADQVVVDRAPGGNLVVVYDVGNEVRGRFFDALGTPQGIEFVVAEVSEGNIFWLDIGLADSGDFVVAWSGVQDGQLDIFARRMGSNGAALGDVFRVNSFIAGAQTRSRIAVAANGDFAVTWTSTGSPGDDNSETSIQGRTYGADGSPLSDQFQVNTSTQSVQDRPDLTWLVDGTLAFVWLDFSGAFDSDAGGIVGQRIDAGGQLLGAEIPINDWTPGNQIDPAIAGLGDGGFVVAWQSLGSPEDDEFSWSIQGRVFDGLGVPSADQYQVNSHLPAAQQRPALAAGPNLRVLVAWESNSSNGDDVDQESILGRRFGPLMPEVFADGFESGDTTVWGDAVP